MFIYHSGYYYGMTLVSVYYIPSSGLYIHCTDKVIVGIIDSVQPFFGEFGYPYN